MSRKAAQKRLNRFLRMSGRGIRNPNNAQQHVRSKRFAADVAAGGEQQLLAAVERARADEAAEAKRVAELLGVWG